MVPTIAIFCWPIVVIVLFRKYSQHLAVALSIVAAYLLLPVEGGIDLPLLPAINKSTVAVISILIVLLSLDRKRRTTQDLPGWLPKPMFLKILIIGAVSGALLTVIMNGDRVFYGNRVLPALRPYDAFSAMMGAGLMLLPMLLARKYLARPEHHVLLLTVLCGAGLCYSLLAVYELRMSPQLNRMVYGFFPHTWNQHVRGGGYRPIVFLAHGLQLSIFFTGTVLAACALLRLHIEKKRILYIFAAVWLFAILVLSKSFGALAIAVVLVPLVLLCSVRWQLLIAAALAIMVISYPLSRGAGVMPVDDIQEFVARIDAGRAASLGVRLEHEEALLEKASVRPVFGWGGWGRSRIYDEDGRDVTIADGYWAIAIGVGGWIKYLSEFLMMGGAIVLLALRQRIYKVGLETSALALITAGWMVDLIPNSALSPLLWLTVGALWGRFELGQVTKTVEDEAATPAQTRTLRYSRWPRNHPTRGRPATYTRAKPSQSAPSL